MNVKALKDYLQNMPDDYEIRTGNYFARHGEEHIQYFADANEKFIPVNDEFILGISQRDDKKEIRIIGIQASVEHFGSGDFAKDSE